MRARWLAPVVALGGCLSFHPAAPPGAPADATFATVEGVPLRYLDVGEGPPVILLHGFASSLDIWQPVIPALSARHRVIAIDLKGFGWSGRPAGDYSPQAQARLVLGLLDQRGVDRAVFVGHSWGAGVALALAAAAPERVERLALVSAYAFDDQVPSLFRWARLSGLGELVFALYYQERIEDRVPLAFHDPALVTQDRVERIEKEMARPGTTAAHLAAVRGQEYGRAERLYPGIAAPVLIAWGREDIVTPLRFGERLARLLPAAELVVYPRCGHVPMIEAQATFTRDLLGFLEPAPAPARAAAGPAGEDRCASGASGASAAARPADR